jgi:hypothetical protein
MSEFSRLKKILTWTIMSTAVLALTVTSVASGNQDRAFGVMECKYLEHTWALQKVSDVKPT